MRLVKRNLIPAVESLLDTVDLLLQETSEKPKTLIYPHLHLAKENNGSSHAYCMKCGTFLGFGVYEKGRVHIEYCETRGGVEYLLIRCARCRFSWKEHTKDYVPPPIETIEVTIKPEITLPKTPEQLAEEEIEQLDLTVLKDVPEIKTKPTPYIKVRRIPFIMYVVTPAVAMLFMAIVAVATR